MKKHSQDSWSHCAPLPLIKPLSKIGIWSSPYICICIHLHAQLLSRVWLFCDPMTCSPPGSSVHGILPQEYRSGLPFPSPGDLPSPEMEPMSSETPALVGGSLSLSHLGSACVHINIHVYMYVCMYLCMYVCVTSLQSYLTFCSAMDHSPPGSSVHRISRQENWSVLPCPPPGDFSQPRV